MQQSSEPIAENTAPELWALDKCNGGAALRIVPANDPDGQTIAVMAAGRAKEAARLIRSVNRDALFDELVRVLDKLLAAIDEQDERGILPADKGIAKGNARATLAKAAQAETV